eukprot:2545434-Amphidinium_carterae.1
MRRHRCTGRTSSSPRLADNNTLRRSAPREVRIVCQQLAHVYQAGRPSWQWWPTALAPLAHPRLCFGSCSASLTRKSSPTPKA